MYKRVVYVLTYDPREVDVVFVWKTFERTPVDVQIGRSNARSENFGAKKKKNWILCNIQLNLPRVIRVHSKTVTGRTESFGKCVRNSSNFSFSKKISLTKIVFSLFFFFF